MAWNQPGGSGDKDPWGRKKSGQPGLGDLDKMLQNLLQRFGKMFSSSGRRSGGVGIIIIIALVLWGLTGIFTVKQAENAVVLRFGKIQRVVTTPGLNYHLPYPIETTDKTDVIRERTLTIGYRDDERTGKERIYKEALMLTEDENILDIEFLVKYQVKDASQYLYRIRNPRATVRQATESAVREIIGQNKLDFIFLNRRAITVKVKDLMQKLMIKYETGIEIKEVEMQNARPPEQVKSAFDDAIKAREDKETKKNNAQAYARQIVPQARGQAEVMVREAEAYKTDVIQRAEGDARRFTQVANQYAKAPRVTRERLYIETMQQVMSRTTKIFIDQKAGNNLLYLPLDKLIPLQTEATKKTGPTVPTTDSSDETEVPETTGRSRGRTRRFR